MVQRHQTLLAERLSTSSGSVLEAAMDDQALGGLHGRATRPVSSGDVQALFQFVQDRIRRLLRHWLSGVLSPEVRDVRVTDVSPNLLTL